MRLLGRLGREQGRYFFDRKTTLTLLFLFAAIYLGTRYAPPFIDNYELEKAMKAAITHSRRGTSPGEILDDLLRRLRLAGLYQFKREDFTIRPGHGRVEITAEYEAFINLGLGYGHNLAFSARAADFQR